MSRYIDADALIAELQKDEERFDKEAEDAKDDPSYTEGYSDAMWSRANGIRDAIIEIHDAPSIDIVRCGECKYCSKDRIKWSVKDENGNWIDTKCNLCRRTKLEVSLDDFCSCGEREGE